MQKIRLICGRCGRTAYYPLDRCFKSFEQEMPMCHNREMLVLGEKEIFGWHDELKGATWNMNGSRSAA